MHTVCSLVACMRLLVWHLHNDSIGAADGDVVRMFQLSRTVADGSKFADESAVRLEDLHAVVFLIADVNKAERVGRDAPRVAELAIGRSLRTEHSQEASRWIEHLDTVIVSVRL